MYSVYHTKETLEGFGDFGIGEQAIHTMKYAHDLVQQPYKVDQINAYSRKLILTSKKEELSANSTGIRGLKCNWTKEM
jgi:hypothetical protein